MATSLVHKLLKKSFPPPSFKVLASFSAPQLSNTPLSPFLHQTLNLDPEPDPNPLPIQQPFRQVFSLNPISLHGIDLYDGDLRHDDGEDRAVIRADSVKKKRKRKMNKHKLRKLRRRLRRKT